MTETTPVTCPSCFQEFGVPAPSPPEVPCDVDYDCEICCRPMVVHFFMGDEEFQDIEAEASSLDDL